MRSLSFRTNFDGAIAESHICLLYAPVRVGAIAEGREQKAKTHVPIITSFSTKNENRFYLLQFYPHLFY